MNIPPLMIPVSMEESIWMMEEAFCNDCDPSSVLKNKREQEDIVLDVIQRELPNIQIAQEKIREEEDFLSRKYYLIMPQMERTIQGMEQSDPFSQHRERIKEIEEKLFLLTQEIGNQKESFDTCIEQLNIQREEKKKLLQSLSIMLQKLKKASCFPSEFGVVNQAASRAIEYSAYAQRRERATEHLSYRDHLRIRDPFIANEDKNDALEKLRTPTAGIVPKTDPKRV